MTKKLAEMGAVELWTRAQNALLGNRLREAKDALDELGLRFDDAYDRLEAKIAAVPEAEAGKVWS